MRYLKLWFFVSGLVLLQLGADAQTFTVLHHFSEVAGGFNLATNDDGAYPQSGLVLEGNTLYGTTSGGGGVARGNIYKINTDGTGFAAIYSFGSFNEEGTAIGTDGKTPIGGLAISGDVLYGTTSEGGALGNGTVFRINTDGTGFTNLHHFSGSDGRLPLARLTLVGDTLYGTTRYGGTNEGAGTVFRITTNGTEFVTLHHFSGGLDGAYLNGAVVVSENMVYGTTEAGTPHLGSVFKMETNGANFTVLYAFPGDVPMWPGGRNPLGGLALVGNTLFGTTEFGGTNYDGTIFKLNVDGSGFSKLMDFNYANGSVPLAEMVSSGDTLYGACMTGGGLYGGDAGSVFKINADGTGFSVVHSFIHNVDGNGLMGGVIFSEGKLYGTAKIGGNAYNGTIYRIDLQPLVVPKLTMTVTAPYAFLSWSPTNVTGYHLQEAPDISGPYQDVRGATQPYVHVLTTKRFFRLKSN